MPAAYTVRQLIGETQRHLFSGFVEERNSLAAGVAAGATQLTLSRDLKGIKEGSMVEVDLELFYVSRIDASAKIIYVDGAQLGSYPADHLQGAAVIVQPRFSQFGILSAINEELADLSAPTNGLYQIKEFTLTTMVAGQNYDLSSIPGALDILDVSYSSYSTVLITYSAQFGQFTALDDDVTGISGIPVTARDILPLGAAIRLQAPSEIKRNFTEGQGEPRRAGEVPSGGRMNAIRSLEQMRQRRIKAESARLSNLYPTKRYRS